MPAGVRSALAAVAVFAAFFLASVLGNAAVITEQNLEAWLIAAALPSMVITVVARGYAVVRARQRGSRQQTLIEGVASSTFVGFLFGILLLLSLHLFELESRNGAAFTLVLLMLSVGIVGLAWVSFVNSWHAENERRRHLLEEGISVALARQEMTDINERLHVALSADIDQALAPTRLSIEERIADEQWSLHADQWDGIARQLRAAAQDTVRPLSRRLWTGTVAKTSPLRVGWILRNIVTKQPFQPLALSLIYVVTSFGSAITDFGWLIGLGVLVSGVLAIFVLLGGANMAMRRWPQHHAMIFILAVVATQATALLNFELMAWAEVPYTWGQFIGEVFVGVLLILLTSGVGSFRAHRDDVARTFQADIDRELVQSIAASRQSAQLARESARILHGSVQTRLIACAVAIEQASEVKDAEAFQAALHEAQRILQAPTNADDEVHTTVTEEVQRKVGLWAGLCSIDVVIAPEVETMSGRLARDVGRVVEEGLSNAIRHGLAKEIVVRVELVGVGVEDGVVVVVDDNGTGPSNGQRGLGSSMLDSVSSSWELSALDPGARLRVVL